MKRIIPAALIALFAALPVFAGVVGENPDNPRDANHDNTNSDGDGSQKSSFTNFFKDVLPVPAEQAFTPPELAKLGDWTQIRNNYAWGTERFIISKDSLSIGDKDKIVRYAVGIPLRNGKYNYVYEGLDCDTGQYRTYYYANSDNPIWATLTRKWQQVQESGYNTYQSPLYDSLCSMRDPLSIKDMKSELGNKTPVNASCPGCRSPAGTTAGAGQNGAGLGK